MSREMMAVKIEPDMEPEEEFFTDDQLRELVGLRKRQIKGAEFTEAERKRFLELQALETEAKTGFKLLDAAEYDEYLELSKKDTYTPEESSRFVTLQTRLDKAGRKEGDK